MPNLITTDGTTLLETGDKSGIAEIMTAIELPVCRRNQRNSVGGPNEEIVSIDEFGGAEDTMDFATFGRWRTARRLQYETLEQN